MSDIFTETIQASDVKIADFMATNEYQGQLALAYDEYTRGYDDSCPNDENKEET